MSKKRTFYPELEIDKTSGEALHLQIGCAIRLEIRKNRPEHGTRLISERKMAEMLKLDRSTVHRAYNELINDGLIEKKPPLKGFFITSEAHDKLKKPFPVLGVVIPEKFSEYIEQDIKIRLGFLNGIIDQAAKLECTIMMIQMPLEYKSDEFMNDWMIHVIDRLDGIIHLGERGIDPDPVFKRLLEYDNVPQIFISGYSSYSHIGSVIADPVAGVLAGVEYLGECGHVNVGTVSFYKKNTRCASMLFQYESETRLSTILDCLHDRMLNSEPSWQLFECFSIKDIQTKLEKIFAQSKTPTAFCCINDDLALKTIKALGNIGLKVPDDISVIGYDNLIPQCDNVSLTSVKLPFYTIGSRAVEILIKYHDNEIKSTDHITRLPTSLVIRNSVKKYKPENKGENLLEN